MYACPQGSLPNPHLKQQSFFLHSASWVPASQFSVSPDGKFTLLHQCSFVEWGKEQKRIKVRICQGQGMRLEPGVGKEAVQSCGKLEWIRQRQPVAERSGRKVNVNRQRNSRMNWWLMESISHTALPSCKKPFICLFFFFFFFLWEPWEAIIKGTDPRQSAQIWGACACPCLASLRPPPPTFTRANWVARLKPEGTNWCCGAFLQSAKDQSN